MDNKIEWWVDERGNYWHESVGIIAVNKNNKMFCMLRKIFPFSYTLPAGHLDKGEKPKKSAVRELEEETGI
ncbi:MAG: NUDIX domain-containing protein [Patescibacteria group bacterium]